ncbi:hypothetical protein Cylst_2839 [Cylindrospermum stagnale PCC 7417]|uniref:Uncharacterized protein n=1 Tax=Cylindrospermum stagnale PCC 7417 TaxID=56107 RepID=K9WXU8_9NOST|nr:hypothetical protein [Cylindrospermum stagnale]AFZ25033.1 hypothetical protein Cylst_2839 [Cylindrospermum stagnale PCC 7417]
MKATIKDSQILKTVNPDVLQAHLQATGWHETGRIYNDAGAIWRLRKDDENEYEILLPLQHNLGDYAERISDILKTLEIVENRSQVEILSEFITNYPNFTVQGVVMQTATSEKTTQKAVKTTINLGSIPLDVCQMPDGSYKLYVESVIAAIDRPNDDLLRFLQGKSPQALPYKDRSLQQEQMVEVEDYGGYIKPIPVNLATAYWLYHAIKGNPKAQALVQASLIETIERRADKTIELKRAEEEYNQKFGEKLEYALADSNQEINDRRLPGDDLYISYGFT